VTWREVYFHRLTGSHEVAVSIPISSTKEAKKVFAFLQPQALSFQRHKAGRLEILIPAMNEYAVMVIEK
jgi:hypothetical protein